MNQCEISISQKGSLAEIFFNALNVISLLHVYQQVHMNIGRKKCQN